MVRRVIVGVGILLCLAFVVNLTEEAGDGAPAVRLATIIALGGLLLLTDRSGRRSRSNMPDHPSMGAYYAVAGSFVVAAVLLVASAAVDSKVIGVLAVASLVGLALSIVWLYAATWR